MTSERPVHVPKRMTQLAVPIGVVLIIVMLVVPLPAVLLDLLLAANISISILILLVAMFVNKPLDFASFPAVILVLQAPRGLDGHEARPVPAAAADEARPPPDPLFLSTLRLRV